MPSGLTAQVLRNLPRFNDPNLLVGADHFDDAGVYRISDTAALVTTLDFFPPLVDDPFVFGQIAAANALSDIYAMGAKPIIALNIVGFPDKDLPIDLLSEIIKGGAERVKAAGAVIAGGHSVRDSEIKYGLSVTGLVHPDHIMANAGAKPGDRLILTKPIGSGILTSAAKAEKISQDDLNEAIEVMVALNTGACEAMLECGAHAATDITGFGLIGHAFEMAGAGGVTLEINARAVPLLDKTLELAGQGIITRAHKSNLEHVGDRLHVDNHRCTDGRSRPDGSLCADDVDETLVKVLADAQTSGGLLIAVPADRVDALLNTLKIRNTPVAVEVGRVSEPSEYSVVLR